MPCRVVGWKLQMDLSTVVFETHAQVRTPYHNTNPQNGEDVEPDILRLLRPPAPRGGGCCGIAARHRVRAISGLLLDLLSF